jgi:hypothetical protein
MTCAQGGLAAHGDEDCTPPNYLGLLDVVSRWIEKEQRWVTRCHMVFKGV